MTEIGRGNGGEDNNAFTSKKDAVSAWVLHVLFLTAVVAVLIPLFTQAMEPLPFVEGISEGLPLIIVAGAIGVLILILHAVINEASSKMDLDKNLR